MASDLTRQPHFADKSVIYPLFLRDVAGGLAAARRKGQSSDGQSADAYGLLAKDNDGSNLEVVLHFRKGCR